MFTNGDQSPPICCDVRERWMVFSLEMALYGYCGIHKVLLLLIILFVYSLWVVSVVVLAVVVVLCYMVLVMVLIAVL